MTNKIITISTIFSIVFISSCKVEEVLVPSDPVDYNSYLHLSHTRTGANPYMDEMVDAIDYSKYEMLLLGGDLAFSTSLDDETMSHIDSIFDLSNPNTLWSLGNHDYSDLLRVQEFTDRLPYYAHHKDGITFIVLDTQDSLSNIIGEQKILFENVVDTLEKSSHLILLHHKLIWMYGNSDLEPNISLVSNGGLGDCFYCLNPNNFYTDIYPSLVEVKQKGIEVICIGGDIGSKTDKFEYTSQEGIYFLASGIKAGESDNKALLFEHDVSNNYLTWEYKLIIDL